MLYLKKKKKKKNCFYTKCYFIKYTHNFAWIILNKMKMKTWEKENELIKGIE